MTFRIKGIDVFDFFRKARIRSVYIYILRTLFVKINSKIQKLEDVFDPGKYSVGSTLTVTQDLKTKLDRIDDFEQIYIIEQYMYRFLSCPQCVEEGECIHCHCKIPARMFVRSDKCSMDYWGPFKNEEQWNLFKKKMGFE